VLRVCKVREMLLEARGSPPGAACAPQAAARGAHDAEWPGRVRRSWSAPDSMQTLYKRVCEYMELDDRVEVLNNRFQVALRGRWPGGRGPPARPPGSAPSRPSRHALML